MEEVVEEALQHLRRTLAEVEVVVNTLDLVEVEAETGLNQQNYPEEVVVAAEGSLAVEESQCWGVEVEGSLAVPLRYHQWMGVAVGEGGCPLQVEVEESELAAVSVGWQVWGNSWKAEEEEVVEEEGVLGLEVEEEGPHSAEEVEEDPEKTERKTSKINHMFSMLWWNCGKCRPTN